MSEFIDLLDAYWEAAFAECREGRTHDTEDGIAQRTLTKLLSLMRSNDEEIIRLEESLRAERAVSERLLEALKDLVSGLDSATWSSWQTTARFQKQWDGASAAISEVESLRAKEAR